MNTTVTVCSHCRGRDDVALYRIAFLGPRTLCRECFVKLDRMGMNVRKIG